MHPTDHTATFPALLAEMVASRSEHPAVIHGEEVLTYRQLERRSGEMARALLASGVGKGTRIALLAPDGALWLTTFYAALRIGALVTPISTLTTPPELAHILRTSDAQILIGARRFLRRDFAKNLTAALPGLAAGTAGALRLQCAPHLRSVWLQDGDGLSWAAPVSDLLARAALPGAPDDDLLAAVEREVSPADDALVVYTSGSTATPKAVVHGQWAVACQPRALARYFLLTDADRTLCLLPAFWMGGIAAALQVLSTGGTLIYPRSPDIADAIEMIERHSVTYVVVWHVLPRLRAAAVARGIDVDAIRGMGGPPRRENGELIPPGLRANLLGMSESFSMHSAEPINQRMPDDKTGSCGRGVNGIERRVVSPDTGVEVPPGEVGELQLRGGALMTGFYKVERRTVFTADGFYPTKDLVRIDADGYAYFVGRTGDMIKTNSANVSRLEVEAALRALPEVDVALVAGLPDPEFGEIVVAAVVPAPDTNPTAEGIRATLRERLSSFKIPRRVVFITHNDVPLTETGKVRLSELREIIPSWFSEPPRVDRDTAEIH
ncbi:class I adenylate-forming enzyme family protein [Parafrankia sp. EUN1f]|uniref:class I adenylate-forming enzyme family protein n=1 Tax=Parafrankia sp. EUN1f TaxID=102897 RepID=UPI0001C442ED|nr:class I adenylate-forming enzyme family protein [Parafrankia sp. EUN1f]EFC84549.1 AMP-dependent synthetase and ligase [Parafrankia sp. EUN1f]